MFDSLVARIRALEVPVDGAAIVALYAARDALDAKLAGTIAAFDAAELYDVDGCVSTPAWLRTRCGRTGGEAQRATTHARRLARLPRTRAAWEAGDLSGGQVDAILSNVGRHLERFAGHEAALVPELTDLDVDATVAAMRGWRARADAVDDRPPADEGDGTLYLSDGLDGTGIVKGTLTADANQTVRAALELADRGDRSRTRAQRQAEAMVDVCRHFLDHQRERRGGRHRPHLNLVIDLDALTGDHVGGSHLDGTPLSPELAAMYACDAAVHRVLWSASSGILDYGRATRTIPVDLYNAVVVRDRGCRWPGCDRRARHCDGHHLWAWEHGGPTRLDNLVLLCRRHHRRIHHGWDAKLLPDGTFEVTSPAGLTDRSPPPRTAAQQFW